MRAHGAPGGSSGGDMGEAARYASSVARKEATLAATYEAFDRAARALMIMIQARAVRWPDAETDVRGNPIPEELRGEIYNETIRGWDPETPITLAAGVGAGAQINCFRRHARAVGIPDAVLESAHACGVAYDSARNSPMPMRRYSAPGVSSGLSYAVEKAAAEAFCEYLDAI